MLSEHAFTHMLLLNTDFDVIRQQEHHQWYHLINVMIETTKDISCSFPCLFVFLISLLLLKQILLKKQKLDQEYWSKSYKFVMLKVFNNTSTRVS